MRFEDLDIDKTIIKRLTERSLETLTPIQENSIPAIIEGKDLVGISGTGSGKTLAFLLPLIELIKKDSLTNALKAIVLLPTRELVTQVGEICNGLIAELNIKTSLIFGGTDIETQINELKNNIDIILATPGRLTDLIRRGEVDTCHMKILILDECDRMLDMGFAEDLKFIESMLPHGIQKLMYSATLSPEIRNIISTTMKDPKIVEIKDEINIPLSLEQKLYYVEKKNKEMLLAEIIRKFHNETTLIFTKTRKGAESLHHSLTEKGFVTDHLHSDRSQHARDTIVSQLKNKELTILIATDIAARGIDIDHVNLVINYGLPQENETFIHRIGRTGRAGRTGLAITIAEPDEKERLGEIQKLMKKHIPVIENHTYAGVSLKKAMIQADEKIAGKSPKKGYMGSKANGDYYRRQKMAKIKSDK